MSPFTPNKITLTFKDSTFTITSIIAFLGEDPYLIILKSREVLIRRFRFSGCSNNSGNLHWRVDCSGHLCGRHHQGGGMRPFYNTARGDLSYYIHVI